MTDLRELTFDATRNAAGFDAAAQTLTRPALDAKDAEIRATLDGLADSADRWYANYEALRQRTEQAEAAKERVKALHSGPRTERYGSGCIQCGRIWPCPTVEALDQPGDQEAL